MACGSHRARAPLRGWGGGPQRSGPCHTRVGADVRGRARVEAWDVLHEGRVPVAGHGLCAWAAHEEGQPPRRARVRGRAGAAEPKADPHADSIPLCGRGHNTTRRLHDKELSFGFPHSRYESSVQTDPERALQRPPWACCSLNTQYSHNFLN